MRGGLCTETSSQITDTREYYLCFYNKFELGAALESVVWLLLHVVVSPLN